MLQFIPSRSSANPSLCHSRALQQDDGISSACTHRRNKNQAFHFAARISLYRRQMKGDIQRIYGRCVIVEMKHGHFAAIISDMLFIKIHIITKSDVHY